jgi:hypothetical protein
MCNAEQPNLNKMNNNYPSDKIRIEQSEIITKKEGYEAMLYAIKAYWENSGSNDLTDILSGGEYWKGTDFPVDSAFWEYWTEAIEKVRRDGPIIKILT